MKKLLSIILTVCMILSVCAVPVFAEDTIKVTVDGKVVDCAAYGQEPVAIDGTTLVPLRSVFEALGAAVTWDQDTQTVISARGNDIIALQIDSTKMFVNGEAKVLSVPAQSMNQRTMVPVRAIAEAFGCYVDWNGDTKTVIVLTTADESPEEIVKKAMDALIKVDFIEASKYCTGDEHDSLLITNEIFNEATGEGYGGKAVIDFTKKVMSLSYYEINDTKMITEDNAVVNVTEYTPNMENFDFNSIFSEEELSTLFVEYLLSLGYSIEELDEITDPATQEEIMAKWSMHCMDLVVEYITENIDSIGYQEEVTDVFLEKIDGKWLIVSGLY